MSLLPTTPCPKQQTDIKYFNYGYTLLFRSISLFSPNGSLV